MSLPIRLRLTAWYAALLCAIVVALGAFLVLQLQSGLRANVDRDVRRASAAIGQGYASEGAAEFLDVSETVLPRTAAIAEVLDPDGRVVLSFGEAPSTLGLTRAVALAPPRGAAPRLVTIALEDHERFRVAVSSVEHLGHRQILVVGESMAAVDDSVRRLLVLLALAGPAALAATAAGGWWLARKALRPVDRITSEAERIRIDRLHERVAVPESRDEIRRLAVTLNAMLGRLEHGVQEQHRLIGDVAHELRTPLAAMRSELDVSLRGDELTGEARVVLGSLREEVDRMTRTVDNILTLAQVDEGRLELLKTPVELHDAVEAALRPLRSLAEANAVRVDIEPFVAPTEADPHRVHQLLTNYLENAIKFSPPGGAVHVRGWRRGGEVGVTVHDDGPGIPPEAVTRLFDRFYRVDPSRRRGVGGSGLGLAICREIAEAHGGRVWVDTAPGRGSAFSVTLPAAASPAGVRRVSGRA